MKEFEKRAYQAAVVKATVVKFFLDEVKPKLKGKSPEERTNAESVLKRAVEEAVSGFTLDELAPEQKLSKKEFEEHLMGIIRKARKKLEERLKEVSKTGR